MNVNQAALLLVDMQQEAKYGIQGVDSAVKAAASLISTCRQVGVPILYTRHVNRGDAVGLSNNEVVDSMGEPVFYHGLGSGVNVIEAIAPHSSDVVIDKHRWSGFHGTSLDLILRGLGTENLIIGGFTTDCCVLTTAYDAFARDYHVHLIKDMCAATNSGSHQAAILMLANWVYDINICDSTQMAKALTGREHTAWRPTRPDQMQFSGQTLNEVFRALDEPATDEAGQNSS